MNCNCGLPWCLTGKESACQCRRCRFDPWSRKIPWRRKWQLTSVFMPGKSYRQRSLAGYRPWGCKRIQHNLATKQQHCFCWVRSLYAKFKTKGQNKTLGQRGEGQRGEGVNTVWMCDLPVSTPSSRPPPAKSPCAWHRQPSLSVPMAKRAGFGSISEITMLQEWTKSPLCTGQTFLEHYPGLSPSPSKENSDGLYILGKSFRDSS